ncbi:MAG: TolC family protein [Bacteroidia bacterium]
MRKGVLILLLTMGLVPVLSAQKLITVDDAVAIAMKNSYDILISRNTAKIDSLNNTAGNAGMLPTVYVNGSDKYSLNNSSIHQSQNTTINYANAGTNAVNAGVVLNWTLYDGGKMFVTKNKLNEIEALGEIQFRNQVMQTAYNVIVAYFNVVKQQQQLGSINKVISFNQERVTILQTSFNSGSSAKNNLLQAKIDLNVSKENAITQQGIIISAKRNLNEILSLNTDSTAYGVMDSIPLNYKPDQAELKKLIYKNNTNLLSLQKEIDIAKLSINEFKAIRLPQVNLNTGYGFQYSSNTVGSTLSNRTYGPNIGGSISIPIFQAGNVSRLIANSKIQLQSAEYDLESSKIQVNTQLQNALTDFENQQSLLSIEQENSDLVKENLEISMQRLRFGQTTALEVRQAQQSYEDSLTRLINFKFNLKVAETKLRQLVAAL